MVFPDGTKPALFKRCPDGAAACGKLICQQGFGEWTLEDGTLFYAGVLDKHNYEQEVKNGWLVEGAMQAMRKKLHEEERDE